MQFDTRKGWTFDVVVLGTSKFKGNFRLEIWMEKNVYPGAAVSTATKPKATPKPTTSTGSNLPNSTSLVVSSTINNLKV